ncbi:lipopolysaccharide heptosyltransferase II [Thermodesulfobacteriota bacterium]
MISPQSILIIKLSAIGDVVHTLPLLEVLRNNLTNARIDWVVEEDSSQIIDGHSAIDHVIISKRKSWQKRFLKAGETIKVVREVAHFLGELRSEEYDVVIDLQGLFKSGMLTGLSRAKRKIGFTGGREGSVLFLTERPFLVDYNEHAIDRYLKTVGYLNLRKTPWSGEIPITEEAKRSVDEFLHDLGLQEKRLVAINPIAKWETKLWEPEKFSVLADRLAGELSFSIVFTGSGADRRHIIGIIDHMKSPAINLAGRTGLKELAYLYSKCRLTVSTDTGPMHIAAAMGTPVVAIFGPTAPWRTGPYGKKHRVIRAGVECSPCFNKKCDTMTCMKDITVQKVFDSAKTFLI